MLHEKRKIPPVVGLLTEAGEMMLNGVRRYGIFIESSGVGVMAIGKTQLLNKRVVIKQDTRKVEPISKEYIRHITEQQEVGQDE